MHQQRQGGGSPLAKTTVFKMLEKKCFMRKDMHSPYLFDLKDTYAQCIVVRSAERKQKLCVLTGKLHFNPENSDVMS